MLISHPPTLTVPTLICQGERDPFGTRDEVAGYPLSASTEVLWLADGDHDLKPRKASGFSHGDHIATVAARVKAWAESL